MNEDHEAFFRGATIALGVEALVAFGILAMIAFRHGEIAQLIGGLL